MRIIQKKPFWLLSVLLVILLSTVTFQYFSGDSATENIPLITNGQEQESTSGYDLLPTIQGTTELSRSYENGLVSVSYETDPGMTPQDVLIFYEERLKEQGWNIEKTAKEEPLVASLEDGTKVRVWIYFTGGQGRGVIYNVDYQPKGAEDWLPLPQQ